ncbi:MAG: phosphocholine cytidylyltransferase family protein [Candidatus Latescibacterota bacterium]|nr:phosphocholine cytidylyltransferase family protein [Candidatus Latescibacterota bacterium]
MKALILAAGRGRRLWPLTAERPKCLLSLGPVTILEHQLRHLGGYGVEEITVVAGYGFSAVRYEAEHVVGLRVRVLYNPFFALADNLISLWSARAELEGPFVLLNGDTVFHPHVLSHHLLAVPEPSCCRLLVQRKERYNEDDMMVRIDTGEPDRLLDIGKGLAPEVNDAASIGLMRFSALGAKRLRRELEAAVIADTALQSYYLEGLKGLATTGFEVECRDIGALAVRDIDTAEDLQAVKEAYSHFLVEETLQRSRQGRA